jgi:hypothetical protein
MTPEQAWRESFNAFERAIGGPMEAFFQSDEFADAAASFLKAQGEIREEAVRSSRAWAKVWNLATADEVEELRVQLEGIRKQLAYLEGRLNAGAGPEREEANSPEAGGDE